MQHPTLRPRRLFPVANAFRQSPLTPSQSPALSSTSCSSLTTSSSDSALSIPFDHLTIQDQDLYRLITVKYDGGPYPHAPSHAPLGPVVRLEGLEHLVEETRARGCLQTRVRARDFFRRQISASPLFALVHVSRRYGLACCRVCAIELQVT
ncbi:hypothetical protein BKA93DRAFT_801802 [Sparassis latifolia]